MGLTGAPVVLISGAHLCFHWSAATHLIFRGVPGEAGVAYEQKSFGISRRYLRCSRTVRAGSFQTFDHPPPPPQWLFGFTFEILRFSLAPGLQRAGRSAPVAAQEPAAPMSLSPRQSSAMKSGRFMRLPYVAIHLSRFGLRPEPVRQRSSAARSLCTSSGWQHFAIR
jgi:hypothetical protein